MSSAATTKKMAVSADQFEDAEEETDELFLNNSKHGSAKKPDAEALEPVSDPPMKAGAGPETKAALAAETSTASGEKDKDIDKDEEKPSVTEKDEAKVTDRKDVPASPPHETLPPEDAAEPKPAPTTPVSTSSSSASPLDALASIACVAEERLQKKEVKPPKEGTRVKAEDISCTDVLCGRGGQSNHHPGNIFFRRLVRAKQEDYLKANKREKTVVAKDIVKLIRMLTPPGRFLKKDPKDENVYVDVGDIQARNKASQALREGAPELREELRDQHNRLNAERGGGPEVKLPYHNSARVAAANADAESLEDAHGAVGADSLAAHAAAAAAHGMFLPAFAAADARAAAALRARAEGKSDPPDGTESGGEEGPEPSRSAAAAAAAHVAAEERARRLMLASVAGGQAGLGAHLLNPHLGFGGLGAMNPFLAGHSGAAAAQLQAAAALQAAGGSPFLSPQALMMAAAAQPPSAAALLHASRARDLASQIEAANFAAATGINPLLLGEQQRAAQFQDSVRLHEIMNSAGNTNAGGSSSSKSKREREEAEREIDENYAKAAKLSRQYL